jgi:selenocysteine lyase/cysteine desulfurase
MIDLAVLEFRLQALQRVGAPQVLGSFSAGSNVTGIASDTRALSRLLHCYSAISAFDCASAAARGTVRMATGVPDKLAYHDVVMLSPHKFAGGPGSCGVLVIYKAVLRTNMPHVPGTLASNYCLQLACLASISVGAVTCLCKSLVGQRAVSTHIRHHHSRVLCVCAAQAAARCAG